MRRALGKGLSQLIADQYDGGTNEADIESILPNSRQPRLSFDESALKDLAASIREFGILQPLVVRPVAEGKYELIAGERRLRAAKLAGLASVPITVRSATNEASLEIALIENVQRENINALECAKAYRQLIDEFGLTQEQVADKVGKSRVTITNTLRLLKLPKRIQEGLNGGAVTEGHARALLGFENEAHMLAVYDQILSRGLTVHDVEQQAKPHTKSKTKSSKAAPAKSGSSDANEGALEEALSTYFGTPVHIRKQSGSGEMAIQFYSDDDLERILEILGFHL